MLKYIAIGLICAVVVVDVVLYCKAKWPERMKYRSWPLFGGFVAYFKIGPDR